MARRIAERICINCNSPYTPASTAQKYCKNCVTECRKKSAIERKRRNYNLRPDYYRAKERERSYNRRSTDIKKVLLQSIKERCAEKNLEFNITAKDIVVPEICPVLKTEFKVRTPAAISVDRIDSSKGYIKGNIQVISRKANTMKNNATKEELLKFADWVYNFYG